MDRQGKYAVQPALDRRQVLDQTALLAIFQPQSGAMAKICETDAGQFATMQQAIPAQQGFAGVITLEMCDVKSLK